MQEVHFEVREKESAIWQLDHIQNPLGPSIPILQSHLHNAFLVSVKVVGA
jgi:hypothetical protein